MLMALDRVFYLEESVWHVDDALGDLSTAAGAKTQGGSRFGGAIDERPPGGVRAALARRIAAAAAPRPRE